MASGRTSTEPTHIVMDRVSVPVSPRTGAVAAPVNGPLGSSSNIISTGRQDFRIGQHTSSRDTNSSDPEPISSHSPRRRRSHSGEQSMNSSRSDNTGNSPRSKHLNDASTALAKARSRTAQRENDAMVYLDGPQVYTCAQCRTHLTSHDEIISKSFHGRHGRAYLFDQCVNVTIGVAEDRPLITGLHSVCDIYCKRCKNMVGWTYARAYEPSQKYKEGKFIIEKINLHLEKSDYYDVDPPAGERTDRFRERSISWGNESSHSSWNDMVYEYRPSSPDASLSRHPSDN